MTIATPNIASSQTLGGAGNGASKMRLDALDSLRGISALMVVFYHMDFNTFLHEWQIVRHSYLFVDFFFVLSGFIMYYNYSKITGIASLGRFMGMRFFRLYPLHIAMLMAFVAWNALYALIRGVSHGADPAVLGTDDNFQMVLNLVLMNGLGIRPPGFNSPSWSISTEFWTYLLFAGVLLGFKNCRKSRMAIVFVGVSVCAFLVVLQSAKPLHFGRMDAFALPRCVFGFFLGSALCAVLSPAKIAHEHGGSVAGLALQIIAIAVAVSVLTLLGLSAYDLLLPVLFTALIATFVLWPQTSLTQAVMCRPLLWLGKHSYSIYMVHSFVLMLIATALRTVLHVPLIDDKFDTSSAIGLGLTALSIAIILIVASQSYRFIEEPGRRLGRRLLMRTASAPSIVAAKTVRGASANE